MFHANYVMRTARSLAAAIALASVIAGGFPYPAALSRAADAPSSPAAQQLALDSESQAMWADRIEPILNKSCFRCHGEKQKGGLDLRLFQSIMAGGTDGSVVIPGRPGESPLFQRVQPDADEHMPPEKDQQISAEEIALIKQWIAALPTPGHPAAGSNQAANWLQAAPSLMDLAASADWTPPAGMDSSAAIDHLIAVKWNAQDVSESGPCDDGTFVRRIYLDLVGRIPTLAEAETFVESADLEKRAALVEALLNSKDYSRRMAEWLDVVLLDRQGIAAETERKSHGWFAFLERSIAANRPWNEIVRDLMIARPSSPENKGAVWFLYEKKNNHQQMAEAVAPIAFGVLIDCAQCHNHPLAHEIKQQNYWGLVAAFNRSTNANPKDGPALSESAIGGFVNFTNLKKESQPAILALLNDRIIAEERPADGAKEEDSESKYFVPPDKNDDKKHPRAVAIPMFSRRQAVADAITQNNPLLARAFVNRIWAMLLGRGIVNPVDQLDSRHAPSHPELLTWIARDFEQHDYDIKWLLRAIVLSQTYQRKTLVPGATRTAPELFARGLEKPLSAEVLYRALLTATRNPVDESTDGLRRALIQAFPVLFQVEYDATLQQAAFLTNSPLIDRLLKPNGANLTTHLLALSTNEERVRDAFLSILGRAPAPDELAASVSYLDDRSAHSEAAICQLEWALLTSAEFLLNH